MKPKTEKKLIKRELLKPKHHIDTCIIIESMSRENTKLKVFCKKYLNLIGYKYRGCFSLPMVGEFFIKVLTELKENSEKELIFKSFYDLVEDKKINFYTPKLLSLPDKIMNLDNRIIYTDASIVACAIEEKAILVTLDNDLLHNKKIEQEYHIKIKSPEDVITSPF